MKRVAEDFELLRRWREGDREAGQELFARHFDALSRFFRNKVDDDAAADLLQTTFLACVERRDGFREDCSFRTFLFAVARRRLYSHFEGRMRDGGRFDPAARSVVDLGTTPTQQIGLAQEHTLLLHALRSLPIELQALLELHYWEHLAGPELAIAFEVPEGTVRTRLRRAKQLLIERVAVLAGGSRPPSTESDLDRWAADVRDRLG